MLALGTAKVDITPDIPVPLAGFDSRSGVFTGVLDPLFARIFCFSCQGPAPVVLVSADLIWWGGERMEGIRRRIRAQAGLENAAIVLHGTHNHSGPQTSEAFLSSIGEASPNYLVRLENALVAGVARAFALSESVTAERGVGQCRVGINRRRPWNGSIRMAPNPAGPQDSECTVIRFRTSDGRTKGILVHYACHPTTTAGNSVSAEFCGAAMSEMEAGLGQDAVAAYLQGCCGDIRPALIACGEFYRGGPDEVRRLGRELHDAAAAVLAGTMEPCPAESCSMTESSLALFFESPSSDKPPGPSVPLEMTRITLAPNLGFVTFNAEMVVEYGLFTKQKSRGAFLPVAYSNGMIGYVTTERQLMEGGYESRDAFRYFRMPGPFAASTERRVCRAIASLLR